MIITDPDKKPLLVDVDDEDPTQSFASAGPSTSTPLGPPPAFAESAADKALNAELANTDVFVPPGGEEPPPEFTPYEAEFFLSGTNIVSHDRHLNEDGEALYRFLLSQAREPPRFMVHFHGSHTEQRHRTVTSRDNQGRTHNRTETSQETIIDFDFNIDISHHIVPSGVHWSVPDEEPAYRGKMYKEVDGLFALGGGPSLSSGPVRLSDDTEAGLNGRRRRKATKQEIKSAKTWERSRWERGLPPWVGPGAAEPRSMRTTQANVLKSSKTLREWADEYCASDKLLKEFTYHKVIYGWNIAALKTAMSAAVKSTYYDGHFKVKFRVSHSKIHVRPDTNLSRMLSKTWIRVILWIFLIFPFIWLYKRFSKRGGGRWEVCGGAYALKQWQVVEEDPSTPPPPFPGTTQPENRLVPHDMDGQMRLVGMKEGEWFQKWEGTIKRAVTGRLKSRETLVAPDDRPTSTAMMLDGYQNDLVR